MSLGDVIRIAQSGGPDAIFLLLLFIGLLLGGRIALMREIDYRDGLIARQQETLTRQQDLFDQALGLLKEEVQRRSLAS